jgi:hypothetical protein
VLAARHDPPPLLLHATYKLIAEQLELAQPEQARTR